MKTSIPLTFLTITLLAAALLLCAAPESTAQIFYVQQVAPAPTHIPAGQFQLRQVNGDGSGDTAVGLAFADVRLPTWSRDGGIFVINAPDPNRPSDPSYNIFAVNPATGAFQRITLFQSPPRDTTSQFVITGYKAFTPDHSAMAATSTIVSLSFGQTQRTTVQLEVYNLSAPANPLLVHVYGEVNGYSVHSGEGVDWSPAQNVLVTPIESRAPNQSGGSGTQQATALFFLEPVAGAVNQGRYRQITFPRGDVASDFSFVWSEHDYQPRFSPNGAVIAYVRSFQYHPGNQLNADPDFQSIRILNLQTGAETEVATFPQGRYVSGLDWSPDGTALVFDLGLQARDGNGQFLQGAAPETSEIYIINTDRTGLRRLRGPNALTPAWKPLVAQQPAVLGNVATRMRVGSGDNAMIGGFIINGSESKKVIVRGMGPSLGNVGVQGALTNPILELFQGNTLIATNDNWQQASNVNEIPNGFAPSDARESVIVTTLAPGSYTAVIRGVGGETGIGVVETYALNQTSNSKLANFSTRGFVESGDNAMIGGFIATGAGSRVLLRAMGPSLRNAGIGNPLQDPTLQLIDGNGATVIMNDNWQQATNANEIPNGFAPSDGRESAIVATLTPGNYTAIVRGSGNTTGVALVEAYHLQ